MKTTYPVKARPTHSEYLSNSFQTVVLFLLTLGITAYALAGSDTSSDTNTNTNTSQSTATHFKLSTGNRTASVQMATSN
jgi:hypothetical protein